MSRIENDFLGSLEIPDDVYYGVQTMRGKQNFHITEMPMAQEPFFPATSSSPASTTISSSLTGSRVVPARPRT